VAAREVRRAPAAGASGAAASAAGAFARGAARADAAGATAPAILAPAADAPRAGGADGVAQRGAVAAPVAVPVHALARGTGPAARAAPAAASPRQAAAPVAGVPTVTAVRLDDALVVPAGALVRGYIRCRALLLAGDVVGNVHCTAGPVVIRAGARLQGRLVASGDVYVCGSVGDGDGGALIVTPGKLTLAPGARVDGDVRSGWIDVYPGATLNGRARSCEE